MRSVPPKLDAELIAFLHDLPDGATEAIGKLMSAAAVAGSKKATRASWISLAVQSVIIGSFAVGGWMKLAGVATTKEVQAVAAEQTRELDARSHNTEIVNLRLSDLEKGCNAANACCSKQSDRLDRMTRPDRVGPW